ncbi:MAG TPA: N-acetylmuramoyl-L-alanine amidase [Devosia sp.]|nr:N-acetylmuramoyl-L-alanine amidase [Devosia sp.]
MKDARNMMRASTVFSALVFAFAAVLALAAFPVRAQQSADESILENLPEVLAVRVSSTDTRARLVVDLERVTAFSFVSLADPMAIAVDVRVRGLRVEEGGFPVGDEMISSYNLARLGADRVRTTLFLSAPMQVQQAYVLEPFDEQPARLVVDLIAETAQAFAERAARDLANAEQSAERATFVPDQPSNEPGTTLTATETRPLILIDPGHGGNDGGAETPDGIQEKTITLAFARKLQELLIATGHFDVALSRDDDRFLLLEQRVQLARENKADLFISIHADTFEDPTIRGASVYTRDEQASDVLDKVLAEQENKVDLLAGYELPQAEPAVVNILVDLMRRETRRQSFVAASFIVDQLKPSVRVRRFPLRRADFFVLQAPDVPSVLLELGFLSNASDEENLISPRWRERVAEAVARGIAQYFGE